MTLSKKFKQRKKYTSSEDENMVVSKVKHNKNLNLEFMVKMLYASEFRNSTFTDLIEGAKQQNQYY